VALRIAEGSAAVEAAQNLAEAGSALDGRLAALGGGWKLDRVVGTTRPRGACLRLDIEAPTVDPPPRLADVAQVAMVAIQEAQLAVSSA
jgi:hypothetical protein